MTERARFFASLTRSVLFEQNDRYQGIVRKLLILRKALDTINMIIIIRIIRLQNSSDSLLRKSPETGFFFFTRGFALIK